MKVLTIFCLIVAVVTDQLGAQRRQASPSVALVTQLYADFACEAVVDTGCDPRHQLVDQPKAVLAKYFDEQLVQLWRADRACAARTREICNLDFLPLWDSQDPVGTTVKVLAATDPTAVNVELRSSPSSEPRVLHFTLVRTPVGWRIHDIARDNQWSLVALLSGKD